MPSFSGLYAAVKRAVKEERGTLQESDFRFFNSDDFQKARKTVISMLNNNKFKLNNPKPEKKGCEEDEFLNYFDLY